MMIKIAAPAKINLTLEVLGKRPDGFHDIRSVMQAVSLCDYFSFRAAPDVSFKCSKDDWFPEQSLVSQAVLRLKETTGYAGGVAIKVEKHIPLISGLGGDSSGAVATLRGLNRLWELGLPDEKLISMARSLGSDLAFFFHGGTALAEGRGEIVTPLPKVAPQWVLLVVPDVPRISGKTGRLYAALQTAHFTDGGITSRLVRQLKLGWGVEPSLLFNTFENVAFKVYQDLSSYYDHILKLGAAHVHLAGSGPALFTMFDNETQASEVFARCKQQGMEAYLARTL
jgi:4-diphosphocytidyl-2-C-methyl-D-erythritol kinase